MTLKELIEYQYDIICENQEQVKQVVALLEKSGVKQESSFYNESDGLVIWLYDDKTFRIRNKESLRENITAHDFLNIQP